ncbi:MAG: hypothetical protein IK148_11125 [Prevotella sp.]|nr:hypothetical protein [Prevotella sp.]
MMKKYMFLWGVFALLGLVACSDETPEEQPERMFALTNLNYSGCKSYVESRSIGDNEYFELKGTQAGNLLVKHANAVFNCASDKFEAKASIEGKTITVTELDVIKDGVMVKCICPYDLDYEIGPLKEGETYSMTVVSTYDLGTDNPNLTPNGYETTFSFVYSSTLSKTIPYQKE